MATDWAALGAATKARPLIDSGTGTFVTTQPGAPTTVTTSPYNFVGGQFTASKDNSTLWRLRNELLHERRKHSSGGQRYYGTELLLSRKDRQRIRNLDIGGSFYTTKREHTYTHHKVSGMGSGPAGIIYTYNGPIFPRASVALPNSSLWPSLPSYEAQVLTTLAYGGAAIAATVPTSPIMSLSNFIGELMRDGLPDLVGRLVRRQGFSLDSLSKEYLNYEFGWKPLVSDLIKLAHIIVDSNRIIEQYERDSGRAITRKKVFPTIRSSTVESIAGNWAYSPAGATGLYATGRSFGKLTKSVESTTDIWFSGVYSYFLDFGDDSSSRFKHTVSIAEKLLGFEITPEVVWNLLPWSWLVDWFVNIGDVFANASAFMKDGLIMRRGYIMCESTIRHTYTLQGVAFKNYDPGVVSQTFESHSKIRKRAYPWGFGLTAPQFTVRQLAILASLGISQSGLGR